MKRNPYVVLAIGAVTLAFLFEVGTRDLGHEFTFFGKLSQGQSAWVRYCVLTVAALLVVAAFVYHRRATKSRQ
ncbi:MAG TPA: hypothetical protein VGN12_14250 [Pirellulales bacterium]|jgi:hypothetical protein